MFRTSGVILEWTEVNHFQKAMSSDMEIRQLILTSTQARPHIPAQPTSALHPACAEFPALCLCSVSAVEMSAQPGLLRTETLGPDATSTPVSTTGKCASVDTPGLLSTFTTSSSDGE